jgi:hypothetical protein
VVSTIWKQPLWSSDKSSWLLNGNVLFPVRCTLNLYMLCRRKKTVSVVQWSEFLATQRRCIVSCEVQTECICYVEESRPPLWFSGQSFWLKNGDVLCFLWGRNWIYMLLAVPDHALLWLIPVKWKRKK